MFNKLKIIDVDSIVFFNELTEIISQDTNWSQLYKGIILNSIDEIIKEINNFEYNFYMYFTDEQFENIEFTNSNVIEKLFAEVNIGKLWKVIKKKLREIDLITNIEKNCIQDKQYVCPICGLVMEKDMDSKYKMSIDHVLPKNSYKRYIFYPLNIVPMCAHCNNKKSDKIFKGIFHPYYSANYQPISEVLQIESTLSTKKNKIDYRLNYHWKGNDTNFRKNFEEIYQLNIVYSQRIYRKRIRDNYQDKISNLKNTTYFNEEIAKSLLKKEIKSKIDTLDAIQVRNEGDEIEFLSLKIIYEDIDNFFESIMNL